MHPARRHLTEDHARLEALFRALENALESGERSTVQRAWTEFESALSTHFEAEERWLFPLLVEEHAADVRELRAEHEKILKCIAEEGLEADLCTLEKETVDELLADLRAHAAREDRTVYAWLETVREPGKLEELVAALVKKASGIV
ncbi:MAG: hemerythrin domain-containing protein [Polyangiaceae bacterium]